MRKSWGLTDKILTGEKTIESRWYKTKRAPWGRIQKGDTIYFKNSGEPVSIRATVQDVLQFENLSPKKVKEILGIYGPKDGIKPNEKMRFYTLFKDKKYCLLIFLSDVRRINPFSISKEGFGAMTSWITVPRISSIKL